MATRSEQFSANQTALDAANALLQANMPKDGQAGNLEAATFYADQVTKFADRHHTLRVTPVASDEQYTG